MKKNQDLSGDIKFLRLRKVLRIMKLTAFLILISMFGVFANNTYSQSKMLNLNMEKVTVRDVLAKIEDQSEFHFMYSAEVIDVNRLVSINVQEAKIDEVLKSLFAGTKVDYTIQDRFVVLSLPEYSNATTVQQQSLKVSGRVTDSSGSLLPGVTVVVKGTTTGTITDADGNYSLTNVPGDAILVFSFVGMKTQEFEVSGKSNVNVKLEEEAIGIDEVVAIGYGSVKKADLTTAISTVSNKDIGQRPIVSAVQAIQGKASGVMISQPNGQPGAELSIRVRGTTSFNGSNNPLYVVDGIPVDNLKFLPPTDIESIQILKDASSAAIYGSRAANGIVIITTRSGKSGQAKITADAQVGVSKLSNLQESLNSTQYNDLMTELGFATYNNGDVTNWNKEIYSVGVQQNYQLSISNGVDKIKYYLSAGYLDDKGIINSTYYKRYNFRAKVDNQIRKWLDINTNVAYSDYSGNGVTTGLPANRGGFVLSAINLPTGAPIWDEAMGAYNRDFNGLNLTNPVEAMENGKNSSSGESRLIASGSAIITFMPELTFKSQYTFDRRSGLSTSFRPPIYIEEEPGVHGSRLDYGSANDTRSMNTLNVFDNVLTYHKSFKKNNIEAMAGTSWSNSDYSQSYMNGSHFRNGLIQTLNAANKIEWNSTGSTASQWGIMSYFGRVAYNFDSKYLLTANVREDGSSKLHPDHRWGTFPSFSGAWRISSEKFMKRFTWLDDMKIRGGWGQTGNQSGVGDYAYLQTYSIVRSDWTAVGHNDDLPGIQVDQLRNSDLTWETTSQTDVGLDLSIFKNRLAVSMDYYSKRTTNMLMYVELPAGQAAQSIIRNEGTMTNKGFEFSINSRNLQGSLTWTTDFNISFNRNKLESLALQQVYYGAYINSEILRDYIVRNEPGRPLGGFYGYVSEGVDPQTGELIYKDLDGKAGITPDDRTYIGDPNPDFIYGMTNSFSWKGFNLSVFMQGTYGNDIYNASRIETESMTTQRNQLAAVVNRWRNPGDVTDIPKAGTSVVSSSYYVENGSYLRIKDISFSYDISSGSLRKAGITRLRPYFTATNLLTFTKYSGTDPEVNQWGNAGGVQGIDWGTYPYSKTFVFGINVEF